MIDGYIVIVLHMIIIITVFANKTAFAVITWQLVEKPSIKFNQKIKNSH
jgi:hypothetical protein